MTLKTWVGIAGIAGFLLSLANAVQTWRRNRPIVSVHPGQPPTDAIEIEIENPSLRPITIIKSQCFPSEPHRVWDPHRSLRAQIGAAADNEIKELFRAWQSSVLALNEPGTAALC
jgi:hypothetical protein